MLLISFLLNCIASTNPTRDANRLVANANEVWCLAPRLPLGGSRQEHTGSSLRRCQSLAVRNQCQQQQGSTATPAPAREAGPARKKSSMCAYSSKGSTAPRQQERT